MDRGKLRGEKLPQRMHGPRHMRSGRQLQLPHQLDGRRLFHAIRRARSVVGRWVRLVHVVHVGGTRGVTWSIDRIVQIHACITWGVELIPRHFFHLFLVCLTDMTKYDRSLFSMVDFIRYVKCVFVVHVGGTRGVPSSTDHTMKRQARNNFDR